MFLECSEHGARVVNGCSKSLIIMLFQRGFRLLEGLNVSRDFKGVWMIFQGCFNDYLRVFQLCKRVF